MRVFRVDFTSTALYAVLTGAVVTYTTPSRIRSLSALFSTRSPSLPGGSDR